MSDTTEARPSCYAMLEGIMREIVARDNVRWTPQTRLAAIDGWNSDKTVIAMLALQRRLGVTLPLERLDRIATVGELVWLAVTSQRGAPPPPEAAAPAASPFARFESLGEDCEFGLVQQGHGVMQPHLLRFSAFLGGPPERLARLTDAIGDGFAEIADPEMLQLRVPDEEWLDAPKEYRVLNTRYGWETHTGLLVARMSEAEARSRLEHFPDTLQVMRAQLLRELRLARRIWIWKSREEPGLEAMEALHAALRRFGPNRLLWVRRADAEHRADSFAEPRPGLFVGRIGKSGDPWSGQWSDATYWGSFIAAADVALPPAPEAPAAAPEPPPAGRDGAGTQRALALLTEIVRAELGIPDLVLREETTPADVGGWDSLKHVSIVLEVEHRLGQKLSGAEMDETMQVGSFAAIISARSEALLEAG